jgi:hypothetical protein
MRYDPALSPDPKSWLLLDEQKRILLIEQYHTRHAVTVPNLQLHAAIHAIVENHVALNDERITACLARLAGDGLGRHEALHAIGGVLVLRQRRQWRALGGQRRAMTGAKSLPVLVRSWETKNATTEGCPCVSRATDSTGCR